MNVPFSRRELIRAVAFASAGLVAGRVSVTASTQPSLVMKQIPGTGEKLPVVGLGTNAYSAETPEELSSLREVLRRMRALGGTVIDTAPAYGRSETVLGQLLEELGSRDRFFLATKVTAPSSDAKQGAAMLEESLSRLRTSRVDLMQVHDLGSVDIMLPLLRDWKVAGKTRYIGITTWSSDGYPRMVEFMRRHAFDFIQLDYSIDNRAAAEQVLPLAQERGMGVLINMPLGGRRSGNLIRRLQGRALPDWASELDISSWPQFLLKYVVSHPAVTAAIPGTTKVRHLEDNQRAARGRLPDAAQRKRMEEFWDSIPG